MDALLGRGSRVLDAGSGTGRVSGELHARGHTVVGVDVDPDLAAAAAADFPGPRYVVADLATFALDDEQPFDAALLAGNVLVFVTPGTERQGGGGGGGRGGGGGGGGGGGRRGRAPRGGGGGALFLRGVFPPPSRWGSAS